MNNKKPDEMFKGIVITKMFERIKNDPNYDPLGLANPTPPVALFLAAQTLKEFERELNREVPDYEAEINELLKPLQNDPEFADKATELIMRMRSLIEEHTFR